MDHRM